MSDVSISAPNPVLRPRLWVETLWLLDSLTATPPLRELPLQRGLHLIVSPPGTGSSGHGVGKTAFCQLLRFVLLQRFGCAVQLAQSGAIGQQAQHDLHQRGR